MYDSFVDISEHHELIETMWLEGSTRADIARTIEFPVHQVKAYMIAQGWFKDPVLTTKQELEDALAQTGYVNVRVAELVGCSESTVRDRRRKFNV